MADSSLKDLIQFLESGEETGQLQGAFVTLADPVARPEGWPQALLEPVVLEVAGKSVLPYVTDEAGDKYLLFHDPEVSGGFMLMHDVNMQDLFHHYADKIRADIQNGINPLTGEAVQTGTSADLMFVGDEQDVRRMVGVSDSGEIMNYGAAPMGSGRASILIDPGLEVGAVVPKEEWIRTDQVEYESVEYGPLENSAVLALFDGLRDYSASLNEKAIFERGMSVADIQAAGLRLYNVDVPEPVSVKPPKEEPLPPAVKAQFVAARDNVAVVPETTPMQAFFDEKIKGDYPLQDLSGNKGVAFQLPAVLANIEKAFKRIDALPEGARDLQQHQTQIAFVFSQIEPSWKGVAADYIQERIKTGEAVPLELYKDSVAAQIEGDLPKANSILARTYVAPTPPPSEPVRTGPSEAQIDSEKYSAVESSLQIGIEGFERAETRSEDYDPRQTREVWEVGHPGKSYDDHLDAFKALELNGGYVSIAHALTALKDNFNTNIVTGDLTNMKSIEIHPEHLPPEAFNILQDELAQIKEALDGYEAMEARVGKINDAITGEPLSPPPIPAR